MTDEEFSRNVSVVRIVLKDLSFETPMGAEVFSGEWQPDYELNLQLGNARLDADNWEVILKVTVTARVEKGVAFLIEAHEAGVFNIPGLQDEPLHRALEIEAPMLIYPYLRETVNSVAARGGFPPVNLRLFDFEARYEARKRLQSGADSDKAG